MTIEVLRNKRLGSVARQVIIRVENDGFITYRQKIYESGRLSNMEAVTDFQRSDALWFSVRDRQGV